MIVQGHVSKVTKSDNFAERCVKSDKKVIIVRSDVSKVTKNAI